MQLVHLRVAHLSKKLAPATDISAWQGRGGFYLETCQRWIWVFHSPLPPHRDDLDLPHSVDLYRGKEAYQFLIRFACGLESEIMGETDVFGQLKESWRQSVLRAEKHQDLSLLELTPWMNRVFEDTKEIRTRYLQNSGGSSYGTLVRKLIRDQSLGSSNPLERQSILVVGAGQVAQSVAPFLTASELLIWNRDPIRLCAWVQELEQKKVHGTVQTRVTPLYDWEQASLAWQKANHILLCVPPQSEKNAQWMSFIQARLQAPLSVIHLGGRRSELSQWQGIPSFFALDDLFELQKSLGSIRSMVFAQASQACEERAKLRALGQSISIPHGWEDLACFA